MHTPGTAARCYYLLPEPASLAAARCVSLTTLHRTIPKFRCGGLGGNCAQANGTGGACYNGLWGGYSCTAGYNCTSDTDYW